MVTVAEPSTPVRDVPRLVSTLTDWVTRTATRVALENVSSLGSSANAPAALIAAVRVRAPVRRRTFMVFIPPGRRVRTFFHVILLPATVAFFGVAAGTRPVGSLRTKLC